jgi:Na+-transporting methylmalonyl-CoA/oxaloacetate decarboxylase gamma subunit
MSAFNAALQVSAWGMGGIFGFMLLFYVAIRMIHWLFPAEEHHHEER